MCTVVESGKRAKKGKKSEKKKKKKKTSASFRSNQGSNRKAGGNDRYPLSIRRRQRMTQKLIDSEGGGCQSRTENLFNSRRQLTWV
ncbi:hypothetical protein GQ53DRAFT_755574 [Thozetella sp. PMI_491]|nr:hypothetical protein GQ53DRAFT_756634 [Thozetella sp. PMI_491]KAH8879828.1 hypothetical protein GQ53DRAFT_755574 [Thozetella sp. PMI_491]